MIDKPTTDDYKEDAEDCMGLAHALSGQQGNEIAGRALAAWIRRAASAEKVVTDYIRAHFEDDEIQHLKCSAAFTDLGVRIVSETHYD